MKIKILIHASHMKFYFNQSSKENTDKALSILTTRFRSRDSSMSRDYRVKYGDMSDIISFYNVDHSMLPTGFLSPLIQYFNEANVEYELNDKRLFPKPDIKFLVALRNKEVQIGINSKTGQPYIPRDHQIETILSCVKEKNGVIWAPMGFGKCQGYNEIIDIEVDDELYKKLKELDFIEN